MKHLFIAAATVLGLFFFNTPVFAVSIDEISTLVNEERAKNNLPSLVSNSQLAEAATQKALDMTNDDYWSHTAPDGTQPWDFIKRTGYRYERAGENLARGFKDSGRLVNAWMASPEHRTNILSPDFTEVGYAVVTGNKHVVVVQMFGDPLKSDIFSVWQ